MDEEGLLYVFDFFEYEGLCMGFFMGINVVGVVRFVKEFGFGYIIVMILCDWGYWYISKIWNIVFL